MATLKESINSLVDDGRPDAQKPRANRQPIGAKVGSSANAGGGSTGIASPLTEASRETYTKTVAVPVGADIIDIEIVKKLTMTDANGAEVVLIFSELP